MTQRNNRSKKEVAEIVKAILVAEKKSFTTGVPIVELENEYKAQDGTRIPYRALGYASLMDFLESLQRKGEIIIKKRGSIHLVVPCIDEKTAHVSALVAGQKNSTGRHSRGGRRNSSRFYPRVLYQPPRLDSKTLADVLKLIKNTSSGIHISQIIEYLHDRNNFTVDENQLLRQLNDCYHDIIVNNGVIHPIIKRQLTPQNSPPKINFTNGYAGEKNQTSTIRPAGLSDEENDNEDFEYVTKSDNVLILPSDNGNNFHEKSQRDPLYCNDSANAACGQNDNCLVNDDNDIGIIVNDRTRFRLEKLIQKHPNGIWCAELPEFYHQEYCIPLNYEEMGFLNVSDFAAHLSDIFHCVRFQETGDFKLFDAKCPKPDVKQNPRPGQLTLVALHDIYNTYQDEVEAVPMLLSPTSSQRLVPEGVMTIGETVAQICVTGLFSESTPHIEVVVVDTMTPTLFWIQLLKKTPKFDQFMTDLHKFYSEHAQKYIMPIVIMERGLNCACIYGGKWHRGVIKTVKPNCTVTVLFYDYGTVLTYRPENIHFLHRSFSSLPAQAIPCGLYNVKPVSSNQWPYSICQVFAEKVMDVPMVAMLGSIDADNNSMLIALTNTEEAVDFHISDWMINSGFAVYGKMGETVDMNEKSAGEATIGPPEMSPWLPTVQSAEESAHNPDSPNRKTAQSSQVVELYETKLAAVREEMQAQFNAIMVMFNLRNQTLDSKLEEMQAQFNAMRVTINLIIQTLVSKYLQSAAEQTPEQRADSKVLDDLLNNTRINLQNKQQVVSSEPPPLPPRPNHNNVKLSKSYELKNKPESQTFNGNDEIQENKNVLTHLQKCNINMNCAENSFNCSPAANPLMAPAYNFDYQLPLNNDYRFNSARGNNYNHMQTLQSNTAVSQAPPKVTFQDCNMVPESSTKLHSNQQENLLSISRKMQSKDPISSIIPRQNFEISLEDSAHAFFARLDAKLKSANQETNPFKIAMEENKYEEKNALPVASSLPPRSSVINYFLSEADASQQNKIASTGIFDSERPMKYDFSGRNETHNMLDAAAAAVKSVEIERQHLEAEKETNVKSWIAQDVNLIPNYVDKEEYKVSTAKRPFDAGFTGDFPSRTVNPNISADLRTNNVFSSIPSRPTSSVCESQISSEIFKASIVDSHNSGTEMKFQWQNVERYEEESRQNKAAGSSVTAEIIPENMNRREETGSEHFPAERESEVCRADKSWDFIEVHLTKQTVHLINLDNESWLTIEEFMTAFTTYNNPSVLLKFPDVQNARIAFRHIERANHKSLFEKLNRSSLGVPRDHKNNIGDVLHLAPLKSLLKLLRKLKIVDLKEVELAAKKREFPSRTPALFDACTLIAIDANHQRNKSS